ncbi:MAG: tetratricopeptide repeat protein [Acidobacteriota bacterium]|nr:tetratricopeptide repeat protein [Acidobacteriota bacterium]
MVRLAELRARQQRPKDAVKALQTAYIDGHTKAATDFFTVAAQLENWNLLADARAFAEQGVALAGTNLLTPPTVNVYPQPDTGAVTYARILTRLGQGDRALETLVAARQAAEVSATSPSVLAAELARENISGDEANGFRQNFAAQHRQAADQNLKAAISAIGQIVQTYYTPEQKQTFALTLDRLHDSAQPNANPDLALQAAAASGLPDREANWRKQRLLAGDAKNNSSEAGLYASLQQRRLQFSELAHTLEAYAARLLPQRRDPILMQANQAFRDAGDSANEARIARSLVVRNNTQVRDRYFDLLLRDDPAALTALTADRNINLADAALNYIVAHASEAQALAAVSNRGQSLPPVWRPASASLVQTYFASSMSSPMDTSNFRQSLAYESTVGDRVAARADPARQLTGDNFFAYASRFGIFLATVPKATSLTDPEDFLPGEVENSPTAPNAYLNLARSYAEANNMDAAVAEYNHALELSPSDPAIEDELATNLYRANRHGDGLTHWRNALAILGRMQQHAMYPESWFTSLETVTRHLGERHLTATFRPEIQGILGPYLAKNGNYRSNELLKAIYKASATPEEGANFILAVANSASDPNQILEDLRREAWLAEGSREPILLRQIELARDHPAGDEGQQGVAGYQYALIDLYLSQNQIAKAQATFDLLSEKDTKGRGDMDRIILTTRTNHLTALLATWRANPDSVPKDSFGSALYRLMKPTPAYKPDLAAIRPLQEFVFEYKRQNNTLVPTDFLALTQLRLDTSDLPGALDLLHQLTLQHVSSYENGAINFPVPGQPEFQSNEPARIGYSSDGKAPNPYINTDYAASLLEKNHHPAEAVPFLQSLVKSIPWDASYRYRLAQAQLNSSAREKAQANLLDVARDATAPYDLRVQAARTLAPLISQTSDLGGRELNLIAHPSTPTAARQPYFAEARIASASAASTSQLDREALLREAIAIAPSSSDADRARLDLLLLQPATADSSATLAILRSMQNIPNTSSPAIHADDTESDTTTAGEASVESETPTRGAVIDSPYNVVEPSVSLPQAADKLALSARIRLASQIASTYQRDGNVDSALAYAELAMTLAKDSPQPELARRRDELKAAVLLARRNALRRPDLHAALAQSIQVRPRLTASTLTQEESQ